jgi:hypothetical protein
MENLFRWGWALLVPLLICAGLAAIVTDAGEGGFWLMFVATLAIGAIALVSAPWRPVARVVATILYLPVMGNPCHRSRNNRLLLRAWMSLTVLS